MNHNFYLAVIEVTNSCNLRCKHCYGQFDGHKELSDNQFESIIRTLKAVGLETIHITGGEPLLLKDKLLDYVKIANQYGVADVRLLTNGLLIKQMSDDFFGPWSRIQISLDGLQKNHDYIRGKGTFDKAYNGIQKLKLLQKPIDIMFTVNQANFVDCQPLYEMCEKEGLNFAIEIYTKRNPHDLLKVIDEEQYKKIINFCTSNKIHCNDPVINVACKNKRDLLMARREMSGCLAGISALVVDVEGNIYPCPRIRTKIGNIFTENLDKIITNSNFVKLNTERDFDGQCGKCKYKYICGGCRALACSLTGNMFSDNPHCFVYEE